MIGEGARVLIAGCGDVGNEWATPKRARDGSIGVYVETPPPWMLASTPLRAI